MFDIKKATGATPIDNLVERVRFSGRWVGVKGDVLGGEALVGGGAAVGFLSDVFVGGAAVFRGSGVGGRGFDGVEVESGSGVVSGGGVVGMVV